jgi:hypothetical protein
MCSIIKETQHAACDNLNKIGKHPNEIKTINPPPSLPPYVVNGLLLKKE